MNYSLAHKLCCRCGETKQRTEFYKQATAKDGLRSWCKRCWCADQVARQRTKTVARKDAKEAAWRECPSRGQCACCLQLMLKVDLTSERFDGVLRGLLCERCRWIIREPGEVVSRLARAIIYLRCRN